MERDNGDVMRLVLDQLPVGTVIAGTQGRVLLMNGATRHVTGCHGRDTIAFPVLFADAVPEDL
jgi:PAS domain-containing protein